MLSCITAVAIATFVGTKALKPNVNDLLLQNVEALSQDGDSGMTCDNIRPPATIFRPICISPFRNVPAVITTLFA